MAESSGSGKGKGTLMDELREVKDQRIWDAIEALREQDKEHDAALKDLTHKFNDERVSSAKSLSSAAAGGGATAGLIEIIMYLVQAG